MKATIIFAFLFCFQGFSAEVYLGVSSPNEGLGVMGHTFLMTKTANNSFFSNAVYSYSAELDQEATFITNLSKALLGLSKLSVEKISFADYLGSILYKSHRSTYLFKLKISDSIALKIASDLEAEYLSLKENASLNYSMGNSCWTRILKILDRHLPEDKKINIEIDKFWNHFFNDFQNPKERANNLLTYAPYFYVSKLRERKDLFQEKPAFLGLDSLLLNYTYSVSQFINNMGKTCVSKPEIKTLIEKTLINKILSSNFSDSAKLIQRLESICDLRKDTSMRKLRHSFLRLMKVIDPQNYMNYQSIFKGVK